MNSLQSSEPGPSRIRPIPRPLAGPGGYPRRLHNHSLTPSLGHSFERKFVGSSTTENRPRPVQIVHTSPLPRHRAAVHTASPTESIIDLTLDSPGPAAEDNSARWSTFRSGYVDISLPPLISGSRISSPETGTDPRPSIDQTPALVVGQCKDMPVAWRSNTNPRSVQPNIHADDPATIRSMEYQRIGGSLSDQHDVLEIVRLNRSRDFSVALEDEAGVHPSSPDYSPLVHGFTSACGNLPLSLGPYDRPRRILHEHDFTYVVTAHGIIDQIGATSMLKLDHNIRSPSLPFEESIDDACILSHQGRPVIIFGHAREQNQITLLSLGHGQVSIAVQCIALSDNYFSGFPAYHTASRLEHGEKTRRKRDDVVDVSLEICERGLRSSRAPLGYCGRPFWCFGSRTAHKTRLPCPFPPTYRGHQPQTRFCRSRL